MTRKYFEMADENFALKITFDKKLFNMRKQWLEKWNPQLFLDFQSETIHDLIDDSPKPIKNLFKEFVGNVTHTNFSRVVSPTDVFRG